MITALVFIGLLLVLELGLRVLEPSLPIPLDWPVRNMQAKYEQMVDLSNDGPPVDVAFVGSSHTHDGIDPVAFNSASENLVGYNAAIVGGISTRAWRWWTTEVVVPMLHPDVVVVSVAGSDLNSGIEDSFWDALNRSPAFERISQAGDPSLTYRLEQEIVRRSAIFRLRSVLREPLRVVAEFGVDRSTALAIGPLGAHPEGDERVGTYELTDSMRTRVGEDLRDFTTSGPRLEDVQGLIQDLKSEGVEVVLLNMPVTDDYIALHPNGSSDYFGYLEVLRELAEREEITLLDFGTSFPQEYFVDPSHLNADGAVQFSVALADVLADDFRP